MQLTQRAKVTEQTCKNTLKVQMHPACEEVSVGFEVYSGLVKTTDLGQKMHFSHLLPEI